MTSKMEGKTCECPLDWGLERVPSRQPPGLIICNNEEQFYDINPWDFLCNRLLLVIEYSIIKEWKKCFKYLEECREKLESEHRLMVKNKRILTSLIATTKLHLSRLSLIHISEDKGKILRKEDLLVREKTAIVGLKAIIYLKYGEGGSQISKKLMEFCLKREPDEPLWHLISGKVLFRMRHYGFPYERTSEEELQYFTKYHEMEPSVTSIVYLASALKESGNNYTMRIIELLKEAEKEPALIDPHMAIRLAKMWYNLPKEWQNFDRAEKLLQFAKKYIPNNGFLNHNFGQLYLRMGKFKEAKQLLEEAVSKSHNLIAWFQLQEINFQLNGTCPNYEEVMSSWDLTDNGRISVLCNAAFYYLGPGKDLQKAARCFLQAKRIIPDHPNFQKTVNNWTPRNVNLSKTLYLSIKEALRNREFEKETATLMEETMRKIWTGRNQNNFSMQTNGPRQVTYAKKSVQNNESWAQKKFGILTDNSPNTQGKEIQGNTRIHQRNKKKLNSFSQTQFKAGQKSEENGKDHFPSGSRQGPSGSRGFKISPSKTLSELLKSCDL